MKKSKLKNKESIHEEDKRTSQQLTIVAKYSEDGDRKKNKWKKLKKKQNGKTINQSICSRRPG